MAETHLAVDFGGTKIRMAHVSGNTLSQLQVVPTHAELPTEALKEHFLSALRHYIVAEGIQGSLASINVAIAGQIDTVGGIVRSSPNLPSWREAPLVRWIEDRFGVPARIENDVRAAALGEYTHGLNGAAHDIVCLYWGTGIGGGVVANGKLLRGVGNAAAEVGHMVYEVGGRLCSCGKRGCYEAYAGGWAIEKAAREAASRDPSGALARDPTPTGIFRLADEGHAEAQAIRTAAAEVFALLAANLVVAFNPQWLILGGGITGHYAPILEIVKHSIAQHSLPIDREGLHVKVTGLGHAAPLWGAVKLREFRD